MLLKYDDTSRQVDTRPFTQAYHDHKTQPTHIWRDRVWQTGCRLFKLQFWLFLTLLPVTLLLFGKASLWGLIVNLFAIGLFGWVIVPLNLLAGLLYLLSPTIADSVWALVSTIVGSLHQLIDWLTTLPALSKAWVYTPVSPALLLMVLLAILPWLLPRGLLSRWLALPPFMLLMLTVSANQQALITIPRLYILPTNDQYISAALLRYPMSENDDAIRNRHKPSTATDSINWLFLADHRPAGGRTLSSTLTAKDLTATLEQQLSSLSIDKLEGVVVQSSSAGLSDSLSAQENLKTRGTTSELLLTTVIHLTERFLVSQYWQAGRAERWPDFQTAYKTSHQLESPINISAQRCERGKTWQGANGNFSIQAMTGWRQIEDASVWDCTVAIETEMPIQVVRYNAADPLSPIFANPQTQIADSEPRTNLIASSQSRLILNTDTHQRLWPMWSLLCAADLSNTSMRTGQTTWVGHSASHMTAEILVSQRVDDVITYNGQTLEAALSLGMNVDTAFDNASP